jgi:hypothetical protein
MNRPKGKYVYIDANAPDAVAMCDYSQMIFNRKDLVKQMEWRGNALVWTGFYVGRPFVDEPNQQLRPPIYPPDPVPVKKPRLQQGTVPYVTGVTALPEPQRLDALQELNWSTTPVVPPSDDSSVDGIPAFPEPTRLQLLQSFNWSR